MKNSLLFLAGFIGMLGMMRGQMGEAELKDREMLNLIGIVIFF